jgi:CDP-diacylglycerol--serine O-phosphatidyltransferase
MNPERRAGMRQTLRRGVYVVPTSFTILNLFFGFRAMIFSTRGLEAIAVNHHATATAFFETACISLLIAAIADTFDGFIARQLHATSEFGKEYDSLADVVTFGAAPAILVYAWGLHGLGRLGVGIAFLFLVSVSLRLARFNVMTGKTDYRYFVGLPSPAGALSIAAIVLYAPSPVTDRGFAFLMLGVTVAVAFAMVSPIRYRSQKGLNIQKERSLMYFMVLVLIISLVYLWPRECCFALAIGYLTSGPFLKLWSIAFPAKAPPETLAPVELP